MEHGRLLSSIREQALPDEKEQSPSCRLRAFVDKETGLWGLEKGDEMLPDASFKEILSIKGRFAVGRLRNGCVRVLDTIFSQRFLHLRHQFPTMGNKPYPAAGRRHELTDHRCQQMCLARTGRHLHHHTPVSFPRFHQTCFHLYLIIPQHK